MSTLLTAPTADSPDVADAVAIELSSHACERYHERVKPALDLRSAQDELKRLLPLGRLADSAPAWLMRTQATFRDRYLLIGDDVVLPLEPVAGGFVAVTCLSRGGISEAARVYRNRRRRRGRGRSPRGCPR